MTTIRKKLTLLLASLGLLVVLGIGASALADSTFQPLACTWDYTHCSDDACPDGPGAAGSHVYVCDTPPYIRSEDTCCGG